MKMLDRIVSTVYNARPFSNAKLCVGPVKFIAKLSKFHYHSSMFGYISYDNLEDHRRIPSW